MNPVVPKDQKCKYDNTKLMYGDTFYRSDKPGCTATEDGYRLEISNFGRRGIVLSM